MALTLQRQFDFYKAHEEEYLREYYGKFVVISEKLETYFMDTIGDAYQFGCALFGLGNFFIQECVEDVPEWIRTAVNPSVKNLLAVKIGDKHCLAKGKDSSKNG